MARDKDYGNTEYCPVLDKVEEQKQVLEQEIKSKSPRTKIIYNKVNKRGSEYHKKFAEIYNNKCAYCGALWGLLPVESFEVDHYLNEASFPDSTAGRVAAVFRRDGDYSIQICDTYQGDKFIRQFYDHLHLGYEARRLDYLGLQLEGMYQAEQDEKRKNKLGEMLGILLKKRNRMTGAGRLSS